MVQKLIMENLLIQQLVILEKELHLELSAILLRIHELQIQIITMQVVNAMVMVLRMVFLHTV